MYNRFYGRTQGNEQFRNVTADFPCKKAVERARIVSEEAAGNNMGRRARKGVLCFGFVVFLSLTGLWAAEAPDSEKPSPEATSGEWFERGIAAYQDARYEEAIALLEESLRTPTGWAEYSYFYLLESHWKAEHVAQTLGFCKAFQQHFPESPLAGRVAYIEAQGYQKSSAYWLASHAYASLLERKEFAEGRIRYGEVLEQMGRFSEARANYQIIREKWPRSEEAQTARSRAGEIAEDHPESIESIPRVLYLQEEAALCLRESAYGSALALCRELEELSLSPEERRRAQLIQIHALAAMGQLHTAHGVLRSLMEAYPDSREVPEGLLVVGRSYWSRDNNQEAFPVLTELLEVYTDSEEAMRAAFILGRIHFEAGDLTRAIRQYRETRFLYPDTEWEDEAAWGEAWCYYLLGQYLPCAEHLRDCLSQGVWDAGIPRAFYWQARSLERAGKLAESRRVYEETRTRYPDSFYSVLAEWRLSEKSLEQVIVPEKDGNPGAPEEPDGSDVFQKLADPALPLLVETGLLKDATERLDWLRQGSTVGVLTAHDWVEAYCLAGDYLSGLRLASREGLLASIAPGGGSWRDPEIQRFLQLLYPLPNRYDLWGKARGKGLDPFLVAGLIHQESVFMPEAVSPAGAVGLMQIMPSTGKRVARKIGLEGFRVEWLRKPEVNLEIGTAYLQGLASQYDADWPKVFAAYNAGPGAVSRWTAWMPAAEADEFIEGIRYRETRIYVKKVLYNWSLYHRIYGSVPMQEASSEELAAKEDPG